MVRIDSLVTNAQQICVVVEDLDRTIKDYVEVAGIGPWAVYTFAPPHLKNMRIRGQETPYSMRLALAWTGDFMWEVIQPLTGPSIYLEFLSRKGEGLHHLCVSYDGHSYEEAFERFRRKGCEPIMEGHYKGTDFAYFDASESLKGVIEIARRPSYPGYRRPPPDYWYPPDPAPVS